MVKNYGRNQVIGEVLYLEMIGHDFVKSASLLYKKNNRGSGNYFITINLLASQALEILPKALIATRICLEKNNEPLKVIQSAVCHKLECLGHRIDCIFNEVPELQKTLAITKIKTVNHTGFINEFRLTIGSKKNKKQIRIKNLESARYGLFARKRDAGGISPKDIKNTINFLELLSKRTADLRVGMINNFDAEYQIVN